MITFTLYGSSSFWISSFLLHSCPSRNKMPFICFGFLTRKYERIHSSLSKIQRSDIQAKFQIVLVFESIFFPLEGHINKLLMQYSTQSTRNSKHIPLLVEWYYVLVRKVHCTTLCTTMYHNVLQCTTQVPQCTTNVIPKYYNVLHCTIIYYISTTFVLCKMQLK